MLKGGSGAQGRSNKTRPSQYIRGVKPPLLTNGDPASPEHLLSNLSAPVLADGHRTAAAL